MTLPNLTTNSKEGSLSEAEVVQQPVAVPARLGVLGWFGSSSSINSGTGSLGAVDETKTQVENFTVERSEPGRSVPDKEEELLKMEKEIESREKELEERKLGIDQREGEVESREKELEERKLGTDQREMEVESRKKELKERELGIDQREIEIESREKELEERELGIDHREKDLQERKLAMDQREGDVEDRCRGLDDREQVAKEGHEEMQRKIKEVEKRERELEERRREFEKEKEKWVEESIGNSNTPPEPEWKTAMETLKKEMHLEVSVGRKKAEERELELETRVMKKVTEILAQDRDAQSTKSSARKRWDLSIKPLTR
jgi:chromosome segregation ATPase